MNYPLKDNKKIITYSLILLIVVPIFGVNFFLSFLGNIILLLFLIPILLLTLAFIAFNSFKSKINICNNCGAISLDGKNTCMNCGAEIGDIGKENKLDKQASESTIDVKAEEVV